MGPWFGYAILLAVLNICDKEGKPGALQFEN
jgi:hypothetical protein